MQPISTPPKGGKVAFQYGLIFGLIQAVIASAVLLVNAFANIAAFSLVLSIVSFLTGLAAYFVAGIFSARQTGRVNTGTFGGMWTGAIYGIIGFVVSIVLFFQVNLPRALNVLSTSSSTSTLSPDSVRTIAIATGVGVAVFGILFAIGLGAGLGALGGLIGRNISKVEPVQAVPVYPVYPIAQPAPYASYPAPAQPANSEQIYAEQPIQNPYREQQQ